ncbi:hypothetical protein GGD41_001454 [Paraburkholderia bryophila]|uniref:DUF3331 domain-containing protein n=2 Tax=Paraburkholderia bryophila TaxID=420952 RepID=A0A7Z0AY51_9BURK|nr:hypothetical protein [Paraburkholderia bryophila]
MRRPSAGRHAGAAHRTAPSARHLLIRLCTGRRQVHRCTSRNTVRPSAVLPRDAVYVYDVSCALARRLKMTRLGPWSHIVDSLRGCFPRTTRSTRKPATHASRACGDPPPTGTTRASSIWHIEWQTMRTILVSWSDSTLGQFQDQTWYVGFARAPGVCGLTGAPVRRGDAVFRPLVRGRVKLTNAPNMILATTIPHDNHNEPAGWAGTVN